MYSQIDIPFRYNREENFGIETRVLLRFKSFNLTTWMIGEISTTELLRGYFVTVDESHWMF